MKKIFPILLATAIFSTGCGDDPQQTNSTPPKSSTHFAEIKDDLGRDVAFDSKPERIVVTSASFIEPLHAVGGEIVGRPDSRTNLPEYAQNIPSIGAVYEIDVEKVIECKPDLVVINKGMNEKLVDAMNDNKIKSIVLDMKSYPEVQNEIKIFSELTGDEVSGKILLDDMDREINETLEKIPKDKKRIAILHSTAQGLTVQLDGSIAGNIAKMFGWENVASGMTPLENNPDAAPYSLETLAEQNPEIIFITSMGKLSDIKKNMDEQFETEPAWQSISAIESGNIFYLPQNLFLLSPGIHYPEAVNLMAGLIYPDEMGN